MLNQPIAETIHTKVGSLVSQPLSLTDPSGRVLVSSLLEPPELINLADATWAIAFAHHGQTVGWIVLEQPLANHQEMAPLIRSIAELVLQQAITIDQLPQDEERLDQFIYDLLYQPDYDLSVLTGEGRLFGFNLADPRAAVVLRINDPSLASENEPADGRELRLNRYRFGIRRAFNSFYTGSHESTVSYLGENLFCVLKDLRTDEPLEESIAAFKHSLETIYGILKAEIKQPSLIGVGNYHPGGDGLRLSFREALNAIELGRQTWEEEAERIYHIDDFGVVAPLLSGVDADNIAFSRELLGRLGSNREIIQTLEVFFAANMSLTHAAATLKIHRNTLVYRLDRIHELLNLDPRAFNDAVQIRLAILYKKFVEVGDAA